jgi:hypothetical protein
MALDFPNTPSVGQIFNITGINWQWDGTKWGIAAASGGSGGGIPEAPANSVAYGRENTTWVPVLALSGDILDGGNF